MELNEYQKKALETANYHQEGDSHYDDVSYCVHGLSGEAGEVANKMKKAHRDDRNVITKERALSMALELGDVLWYVAVGAKELGFSLEEIAQMNYDKLHSRQERGKLGGDGDYR